MHQRQIGDPHHDRPILEVSPLHRAGSPVHGHFGRLGVHHQHSPAAWDAGVHHV
jgi:hypothetical protein